MRVLLSRPLMDRNKAAPSCAFRSPTTRSRGVDVKTSSPSNPGDSSFFRLNGTSGKSAVVGEIVKAENGVACWKLHPRYAAWFWPLMSPVNDLTLQLPEGLLEPVEKGDNLSPPIPPDEDVKRAILKLPECQTDCARVYTLAMRGKAALVYKGFPTRLANLDILRRYRNAEPSGTAQAPK